MILRICTRRAYVPPSLSATQLRQLSLVADRFPSAGASADKGPLLILHGLYGSRQNWRSLSKSLCKSLQREVIALDLRNHGESPHSPEAGYEHLASDVSEFVNEEGLGRDLTVVGHSMGGKVAMALALSGQIPIERLVVVDMSPATGAISPEFAAYLDAMKEIDSLHVRSRKEADTILQKTEPDLGVRQFLLTNLIRSESSGTYSFRLPLDYLRNALEEIGKFPYEQLKEGVQGTEWKNSVVKGEEDNQRKWTGKALFLKGAKSKYINRRNIPTIEAFFPNMRLETLDAGHWVHAERPKEFTDLVNEFCKS